MEEGATMKVMCPAMSDNLTGRMLVSTGMLVVQI